MNLQNFIPQDLNVNFYYYQSVIDYQGKQDDEDYTIYLQALFV